jgi:actin-related protein 5
MLKLLQLKYPGFPSKLANWQAEALIMDHCYVPGDYKEELESYLQPDLLEEKDRVIQFSFTEAVKFEKSQEELDKIAEKRKESGRRLQEQAAKARLEKVECIILYLTVQTGELTESLI